MTTPSTFDADTMNSAQPVPSAQPAQPDQQTPMAVTHRYDPSTKAIQPIAPTKFDAATMQTAQSLPAAPAKFDAATMQGAQPIQKAPASGPSAEEANAAMEKAKSAAGAETEQTDPRSFWQKIKDATINAGVAIATGGVGASASQEVGKAVTGPGTAMNTPLGENQSQEISAINDVIHGELRKGGKKIWNSEKVDANNVIPGSPVEWAIRHFDPDFHGKATPEAIEAAKAKNPNPGEKPLIDIAQFVNKDEHPIAKALAEASQGLTSPENVAIMYSTGGLGLIGKTPQAIKVFGVMQKLISAGFSFQMMQGVYQHSAAFMKAMNDGDANEAEYQLTHALFGVVLTAQGASHAVEETAVPGQPAPKEILPLLSDTDKAVLGKIGEVVGKAADNTVDFSKQKMTSAADRMGRAIGRTDSFPEAVSRAANMLDKKAGPEFRDKVTRIAPDLKAIINEDT